MKEIEGHISGEGSSRCAVMVTGIPLAGKKIICQRAAGYANLVPYLHVSDECAGFVQLARTIATWFQYVDNDDVRYLADSIFEHLTQKRWSRAHDECVNLVNLALEAGLRACFLIDRVQFLDDFSLSLMRECLHERTTRRLRKCRSHFSEASSHNDFDSHVSVDLGKICFLCVHVSLYNWKSASHIVADITRAHKALDIPILKVGEASRTELRQLYIDLGDTNVEERYLDA